MKQSFLDSLIGLSENVAVTKVKTAGFTAETLGPKENITQIARPNTVLLTLTMKGGVVKSASAGDPCQVTPN